MTPSNFNKKTTQSGKFGKASPTPKEVGEAPTSKSLSKVADLKNKFKSIEDLKNHTKKATPEARAKLCDTYGVKDVGQLVKLYIGQ